MPKGTQNTIWPLVGTNRCLIHGSLETEDERFEHELCLRLGVRTGLTLPKRVIA